MLYIGLGQSLLALMPRLRPLGETPGSVDPERAWVFSEAGDPRVAADPTRELPQVALAALHPHLRTGRSGPLTAASAEILAGLGPGDRLLTVNLARRGTQLATFTRPGTVFGNVERCLRRAAEIATHEGLRFERVVVSWVQGQADARTPHRAYAEALVQLVDDLEQAVRTVTLGRGRLLFCLSQTTASYPPGRRGVPLAQVEAAAARPGQVIIAGPEYMLERSDGLHLKPRSAVLLGVVHGRAIRNAMSGQDWEPLRMVDAEVRDREVLVTFAGGLGDLAPSGAEAEPGPVRVGVRQVAHLGFTWAGSRGDPAQVIAANIIGPRQVSLTLSEIPTLTERVRLLLGFPEGIGLPEGFVAGNPETARGAATLLRTTGEGRVVLGLPIQDWALQQAIALRRVRTD